MDYGDEELWEKVDIETCLESDDRIRLVYEGPLNDGSLDSDCFYWPSDGEPELWKFNPTAKVEKELGNAIRLLEEARKLTQGYALVVNEIYKETLGIGSVSKAELRAKVDEEMRKLNG